MRRKVKVLIVDDSMVFREFLARGLSSDPGIEVVATATDPFDARDKILKYEPDVLTLDVELPRMNGIDFLKRLMPQYPLPVVVISGTSSNVFEALKAGAVDFITKPDTRSGASLEAAINELKVKIKIASTANVGQKKTAVVQGSAVADAKRSEPVKAEFIVIGASTGGTEAIFSVLSHLSPQVPGIVIVQHMPPVFTRMFAERLNSSTPFQVKEAQTGDVIRSGQVLVAPGDQHVKIKRTSGKEYMVECFKGEKVSGHCPSVDVLFQSVAALNGAKAVGVILTGMGADGAQGLLAMRTKGAHTIGQDEQSCVVYGMPKVAFDIGAVERQASLAAIPQAIVTAAQK